jgi:hypothetical protein
MQDEAAPLVVVRGVQHSHPRHIQSPINFANIEGEMKPNMIVRPVSGDHD